MLSNNSYRELKKFPEKMIHLRTRFIDSLPEPRIAFMEREIHRYMLIALSIFARLSVSLLCIPKAPYF